MEKDGPNVNKSLFSLLMNDNVSESLVHVLRDDFCQAEFNFQFYGTMMGIKLPIQN